MLLVSNSFVYKSARGTFRFLQNLARSPCIKHAYEQNGLWGKNTGTVSTRMTPESLANEKRGSKAMKK